MRATFAINSAAWRIEIGDAPDYFIKLTPLDEIHAEVTGAIALGHLVDGNDAWMIEVGSSFRFAAKPLQVRFGRPRAQANYFKRDGAIETLLMGAVNYTLTATTDFLQQFVIAKFSQHSCRSRDFPSIGCLHAIIAAEVLDPGYRFVCEQSKAVFQKTSRAKSLPRVPSARFAPHFPQTLLAVFI